MVRFATTCAAMAALAVLALHVDRAAAESLVPKANGLPAVSQRPKLKIIPTPPKVNVTPVAPEEQRPSVWGVHINIEHKRDNLGPSSSAN